jgi:hypothetical protein
MHHPQGVPYTKEYKHQYINIGSTMPSINKVPSKLRGYAAAQ